jgi:calcium-dependent protein kinase
MGVVCSHTPQVISSEKTKEHRPLITNETDIKLYHNNLIVANTGLLSKKYKIISTIGSGAFGKVYKVENIIMNQIRAMKVVKKDSINFQDDKKQFLKEIEMLMNLDHPNIIKIFEYYVDDLNYYVIMEFAEGGELYEQINKLKNFKEKHAAIIIQQLLSAVCYMHSKGIVHRDIKPENIMLESKSSEDLSIKLIDFGTSNFIKNNQHLSMKIGTPYYIAPEVLKKSYGYECDIWSLGVILYMLLSGTPPFDGFDDQSILQKVKIGKYNLEGETWDIISNEAKDLINKMLTYSPENRITAEDALKHDWFKKFLKFKNTNTHIPLTKEVMSHISAVPFENLRKFNARQKIQRATIAFLVHHLCSSDSVKELRDIFRELDTDNNGTLSYNEIRQGFLKYSGKKKMSDNEFNKIMSNVDADKNDAIEYEEFIAATINLEELLTDENLRIAFNSFDKDGSHELSADEIKGALGLIEEETGKNVINEIIKEIDLNGDGLISFEEFKHLMLKVLQKPEKINGKKDIKDNIEKKEIKS